MSELKLLWEYSYDSSAPVITTALYELLEKAEAAVTAKLVTIGYKEVRSLYLQTEICEDNDLSFELASILEDTLSTDDIAFAVDAYGATLLQCPEKLKALQKRGTVAFGIDVTVYLDSNTPIECSNTIMGSGVVIMTKNGATLRGPLF